MSLQGSIETCPPSKEKECCPTEISKELISNVICWEFSGVPAGGGEPLLASNPPCGSHASAESHRHGDQNRSISESPRCDLWRPASMQ